MAQLNLGIPDECTTYKFVDRVEVIDHTSRAFTRYYDSRGVTVVLQNDGRALKVLLPGAPNGEEK